MYNAELQVHLYDVEFDINPKPTATPIYLLQRFENILNSMERPKKALVVGE